MKYSVSKELLKNDDLAQVAWDVIEPLWDDFSYTNLQESIKFLSTLTEGQRALLTIDLCQKEIRNNGIRSLISNSIGNFLPYAVDGLKLIEANSYAALFENIISIFGKQYPLNLKERKKLFKNLNDLQKKEISNIEEKFFKLLLSNQSSIETYRGVYAKNNPEQFTSN